MRRHTSYHAKPLPERVPRSIYRLLRMWQKRLGLQHWGNIPLYVRPFKDMTAAEIKWAKDYSGASISFSKRWLADEHRTDEETESVVVHELCHLIFAPMDDEMEKFLGIGEVYFDYARKREGLCDVISSLFIARYKRAK